MSQAPSSFSRSPEDTPALLVGVTGYMDLRPEDVDRLKEDVRQVFRFLRYGPKHEDPTFPCSAGSPPCRTVGITG